MPKLILDGDSRGAVKAQADIISAQKRVGDEIGKTTRLFADYDRKVIASLKEQKKQHDQMQRYWERNNSQIQRTAKSVRDASGATGELLGTLGRFGSVAGIFERVTASILGMRDAARKAAEEMLNAVGTAGELQQVAASESDFRKLLGQARGFIREGVFRPDQQGQAFDLTFALRNAQYGESDVKFITQLGVSKLVKPENMIAVSEGLKKFQDIFGTAEAGSIRQIGNKIFQAAGTTQSDFATVARASTLFGSEASALKYSDEEALAAFVAIEKASPGPEEAATRMRAMLTQIAKQKLSKGTLTETIHTLVERVRKGEQAIDVLGETRAAAGLNILAQPERWSDYKSQVGEIRSAAGRDIIGSRQFIRGDKVLSSGAALQREQGAEAMALEELSTTRENLAAAIYAARRRRAYGQGSFEGFFEMLGQNTGAWLVPQQQVIEGEARGGFKNVSPETAGAIMKYLDWGLIDERVRFLTEMAERQTRATEELNRKTPARPVPGGRQE